MVVAMEIITSTLWRPRNNVIKECITLTIQCLPMGFNADPFSVLLLRMAEKGLDENLKGPLTEPSCFDCSCLLSQPQVCSNTNTSRYRANCPAFPIPCVPGALGPDIGINK